MLPGAQDEHRHRKGHGGPCETEILHFPAHLFHEDADGNGIAESPCGLGQRERDNLSREEHRTGQPGSLVLPNLASSDIVEGE